MSPTLRSGNLSVLKKRWEQQQQQPSSSHRTLTQENAPSRPNNPETHPPGHQPTSRELTEPRSDVLKSSSLSQGEDSDPETHSPISQHQAAQPEDLSDMEASRDSQGLERAAAAAAAAEVPECEKPSVPLNSLKMMFEKGENLSDQVSPLLFIFYGKFIFCLSSYLTDHKTLYCTSCFRHHWIGGVFIYCIDMHHIYRVFCPKTNILYILVNKSIWIPDHLPDHHKPQPSWKKNLKVIKSLFLDNCEISLHSEDVERWWLVLSYKEKREKMSWLFWQSFLLSCCSHMV